MLRAVTISSLLAAAAASSALAQATADPAAHGFTADGLAALDAHFAELADDRVRAGYALGVARDGAIVHEAAVGLADVAAGTPTTLDTRYRLASMSKPITTVALLTLVDADKVDLDDPVSVYIPTMANMLVADSTSKNADGAFDLHPPATPMTVRELLMHTSGLGYAIDRQTDLGKLYQEQTLYDGEGDLAASIDQLTYLPLYSEPGAHWSYSYGLDVAGRIIEVASGERFEDYLKEAVLDPLGMTSTHFFHDPGDEGALSPVYGHDADGNFVERQNLVFGGSESFASGGGGLISTLPDYLRLAAMLANGGTLDGVEILKPGTVAEMGAPRLAASAYPASFLGYGTEGRSFGLAVQVVTDADATPQVDVDGEFGWYGAYGSEMFIDPAHKLAAVILTSYQGGGPGAPAADTGGDIRTYVYGAMAE